MTQTHMWCHFNECGIALKSVIWVLIDVTSIVCALLHKM